MLGRQVGALVAEAALELLEDSGFARGAVGVAAVNVQVGVVRLDEVVDEDADHGRDALDGVARHVDADGDARDGEGVCPRDVGGDGRGMSR